jgi:hypothetical protein
MSQDMIIVVDAAHLVQLIRDLPGWQVYQIRPLDGGKFNVHISKKMMQKLGPDRVRATYEAT